MCSVPLYGPKGLGVPILDYGPLILSGMYVTALRVITRNEGSETFCRNKMVSRNPGRKNPPCMVDIHWTHYFFYVFAVGTVSLIVYGSLGQFTSIRIRTAVNFTHCASCMLYIYIQEFSPSNTSHTVHLTAVLMENMQVEACRLFFFSSLLYFK